MIISVFTDSDFSMRTIITRLLPIAISGMLCYMVLVTITGNIESVVNNNATTLFEFPQETSEGTSERTPTNDIERRCVGRTDTIKVDSCKENGRICESKSIDCNEVNEEGYITTDKTNGSWVAVAVVITLMIFGYTFFKNRHTRWRF